MSEPSKQAAGSQPLGNEPTEAVNPRKRLRKPRSAARRPRSPGLERTSITLKEEDRVALQKLSMFFIERGFRRVQTSSLVQLSLQVTAELLHQNERAVLHRHDQIRQSDRRKSDRTQ